MHTRQATITDITQVLELQNANLYDNLTEKQRSAGFVTTPFTTELLQELLGLRGLFVAEAGDEIIAYAMAAGWNYYKRWPIFPFMVSRFPFLTFLDRPILDEQSFQYGPVCIREDHRGTEVLPCLFEEMRVELATRFPMGVTFINRVNQRSLTAHTRKLGMTVIDEFEFAGRSYFGLAFDTSKPV